MIKEANIYKSDIKFEINPLIELLSVIQVLSDDINSNNKPYYYIDNNKYIDDIKNSFKEYKDYDAITKYKNYNIFNSQILNYDFINNELVMKENNNEKIKEYYSYLKKFVDDSNFIHFFNEMNNYYNEVLNYNTKDIKDLKLSENLSKYYNSKVNIKMILKMIQSDWGEYLGNKDNEYTILGGTSKIDKYPIIVNEKGLTSLAIHECTHPFVNKYLTNDYDLLAKTEKLYIELDNNCIAKKEYHTYNNYLEDLIVRSISAVIQYKYEYKTKDEFIEELNVQKNIGFINIDDISNIFLNNDFETGIKLTKEYLLNKYQKNNMVR